MPVYEDMRQWVVDRQKAQARLEKAETPYQQAAQEKYIAWLEDEKPTWLENVEQPKDAA